MTRLTSHALFVFAAACALPVAAQNCSLTPGSIGLGNYCADAARNDQKVSTAIQANTRLTSTDMDSVRTKEATPTSNAPRNDQKPVTATQANTHPISTGMDSVRAKESIPATNQSQAAPAQTQRWSVLPTDGRLAVTFDRWATAAGMKLIWDAQQHVMLSSSDTFEGTLEQALARVLSSSAIRQSAYPLEACIYPNNPPVLRITRLTEQAQECPQ